MVTRIERPEIGATDEDLKEYLRALGRALDEVGVLNGQEFMVVKPKRKVRNPDRYALDRHDENQPGASGSGPGLEVATRAALFNLPRSGTQRDRILRMAVGRKDFGITSDEVASALRIPPQSVKPRIVELREGGWLKEKCGEGRLRKSNTGAKVQVHVVTAKGVEAISGGAA